MNTSAFLRLVTCQDSASSSTREVTTANDSIQNADDSIQNADDSIQNAGDSIQVDSDDEGGYTKLSPGQLISLCNETTVNHIFKDNKPHEYFKSKGSILFPKMKDGPRKVRVHVNKFLKDGKAAHEKKMRLPRASGTDDHGLNEYEAATARLYVDREISMALIEAKTDISKILCVHQFRHDAKTELTNELQSYAAGLVKKLKNLPDGEMTASLSTLLLNKLGVLRNTSVSNFNTHIKLSNLKKLENDRRLNLVKQKRKRLDVIMNEILISKHQMKKEKAQVLKIVNEMGRRRNASVTTQRFVNAVNVIMEHVDNCDETSSEEEEEDVSEFEENENDDTI